MEPKYAAPALLIAAVIGCFFLYRWLVRRANAQYEREVEALHQRLREKQAAREAAGIAERVASVDAAVKTCTRQHANAYDARKAQVRHEHERGAK